MPNHITNVFEFNRELTNEELEILKKELYTTEKQNDGSEYIYLDFSRIIPEPKILIRAGIGLNTSENYTYYYKKNPDNLTEEEFEKLFSDNYYEIHKNGKIINRDYIEDIYDTLPEYEKQWLKTIDMIPDWYHWNIDNWGTKWNSYSNNLTNEYMYFNTAWSMPSDKIVNHIFETFRKIMTDEEVEEIDYSTDDEGDNVIYHYGYDTKTKKFVFKYEEEKTYDDEEEEEE